MKKHQISLLLAGIVVAGALSGCVSPEEYDTWQLDAYKAEGKELERFEKLASEYEYSVLFDAAADETVMRGATGTGFVELYPGGNIEGDGGNPVSVDGHGGLANDAWESCVPGASA